MKILHSPFQTKHHCLLARTVCTSYRRPQTFFILTKNLVFTLYSSTLETYRSLCSGNGIGPKYCYLFLIYGFDSYSNLHKRNAFMNNIVIARYSSRCMGMDIEMCVVTFKLTDWFIVYGYTFFLLVNNIDVF